MEPIFEPIISEIETRLSNLGLYMVNVDIGVVPASNEINDPDDINLEEIVKDREKSNIYITGLFQVSDDIAWRDRVINPEVHAETQQFKQIAPTEFEIGLESFKDDLINWEDED
jgi:hypothetical protein